MAAALDHVRIRSQSVPPKRIPRKRGPASEASFDALREEGIRLVQALSGRTWTDYNLHDPGVTILEQLCYALTELIYRTEFPVADHLTGELGRIDYTAQALHGPARVFPCRPTTIPDYRRALLDTIDAIDNAWLSSAPDPTYRGLYRIAVKHSDNAASTATEAATRDQVRAVYRSNRNLCEDVGEVASIANVEYDLLGEFEIGGSRNPSDIVADIYDHCAKTIAAGVVFRSFEWALERGQTLDEILNPRHTRHGVLPEEDLAQPDRDHAEADRDALFVGDLVAQIRSIEGVRGVKHLALGKPGETPTTGSLRWDRRQEAPRLRFPPDESRLDNIRLFRGEGEVRVSVAEVRAKYRDLRAREHARRHARQDIAALRPPPRGAHRDLQRYASIQNEFPAIYGINAPGLPASVAPERKAQARQLKAYLVLFEQIIANGAAQLHHLRELFSVRKEPRQTYWWQTLDDSAVPGIGALYRGSIAAEMLPALVYTPFDPYQDRRNRVLDYLLALHGETFAQNSLRQWMRYHDPGELDEILLSNKLTYLRNILRIGRDRAGGFDYSKPSWNMPVNGSANRSGFQMRASLLLGFKHPHSRALTSAIRDAGLDVGPYDDPTGNPGGGEPDVTYAADDERDKQLQRVAPTPEHGPVRLDELRGVFTGRGARVSEALLRYGVDLDNYRIGRLQGREESALVFRPEGSPRWWLLASPASPEAARDAANRLRRCLIDLNVESEGMHVVEHILLRPAGQAADDIPASFYSLRMTVIFPAWTARGHQPGFRRFAEETIQLNCPAHVHPECLWLGFQDLCEFEDRYRLWLEAKVAECKAQADPSDLGKAAAVTELDAASRAVVEFLLRKDVTREMDGPADV